jgi:hypothetical protein
MVVFHWLGEIARAARVTPQAKLPRAEAGRPWPGARLARLWTAKGGVTR